MQTRLSFLLGKINKENDMKEIKTYIRIEKAEDVIHALEVAGAEWITAIEVNEVGASIDLKKSKYCIEYGEKVFSVTKLEILCRDKDVERFMEVIREESWTSRKGDGIIIVTDVLDAVRIRTGDRGEDSLRNTLCP